MRAPMEDTLQIDVETFARLRRRKAGIHVLDVRESWERELCAIDPSDNIPLGRLPDRIEAIPSDGILVVVCHHGMRSQRAVMWLRQEGFRAAVNLEGGIDAWADRIDRTMVRY